ncbi:MAG: serine/threonine protein kinase [Thermoguttaceae bacterium]
MSKLILCTCGKENDISGINSEISGRCLHCGRMLPPSIPAHSDEQTHFDIVPNQVTRIMNSKDILHQSSPSDALQTALYKTDAEETRFNLSNETILSDGGMSPRHSKITPHLNLAERVMQPIHDPSQSPGPPSSITGHGIHKILRTHQKGGMGRILIAYDQFLKRDIALKELHPEVALDMSVVRRFIGEAEITAQLEHPGIVPIHTLGLDNEGHPYYTMKLIKGRTLHEAIKAYHHQPNKNELMNLVRRLVSVCKTMSFAHQKGVIHRDLKPANIMLGEHGETLVMDWGLAKPIGATESNVSNSAIDSSATEQSRPELTIVGSVVGTPAFMSPEQALPETSTLGPHSDVFSLGAILYYLLTGQTAFSGRSASEVLKQVRESTPPIPSDIKPGISRDLEAICLKAMARNPNERYKSTAEMDADLCRWLDGEPVSVRKETGVQRISRLTEKHRFVVFSLIIILILSAFSLAGGIYLDRIARDKYEQTKIYKALYEPVNLLDQERVSLCTNAGVEISKAIIQNSKQDGDDILSYHLVNVQKPGMARIELAAPAGHSWNFSDKSALFFSLFDSVPAFSGNMSRFSIRIGCGSSYIEYAPEKWWLDRSRDKWNTYTVPLKESGIGWTRTTSGEPSLSRIDWIEFHFNVEAPLTFRISNLVIDELPNE